LCQSFQTPKGGQRGEFRAELSSSATPILADHLLRLFGGAPQEKGVRNIQRELGAIGYTRTNYFASASALIRQESTPRPPPPEPTISPMEE